MQYVDMMWAFVAMSVAALPAARCERKIARPALRAGRAWCLIAG